MLNILNPNNTVELLRRDEVPPLIAPVCLSMVLILRHMVGQPSLIASQTTPQSFLFTLFGLLVGLATIWIAYKANGGAKGRDFLTRYVILMSVLVLWVITSATILYYVVFYLGFAIIGSSITNYFGAYGPAQFIFTALTSLAFMLLIQHYMSKLGPPHAT